MKYLTLTIPDSSGNATQVADPTHLSNTVTLDTLIRYGESALFAIAVIAALFFLTWGGILWTTSGGDKEKVDKARKTIIYAIIGLVVTVLAYAIVNFVKGLLTS
jgi:hypothetical protein